jgi:hypothetical protein
VTASEPGGTGSTVLDAFGVHVEVRVAGARSDEVLARLVDLWEHCHTPPGARAEVHVDALLDDDAAAIQEAEAAGVVARPELADLLQLITQRVTEAAVDARAGECVMLHAACLADPTTGEAVAFVAAGGTGKTTLVRTLGPGRWYVTDETTVVLEDGTVVPYPKPLSVRRAPGSLFKDETAPSSAGLVPPAARVHLAGLCLLARADDHEGPAVVETLATLDGVVALVPQTSHLTDLPRPLRRLAELCESVGGVHRVRYREATDLEALWERLLGAPT